MHLTMAACGIPSCPSATVSDRRLRPYFSADGFNGFLNSFRAARKDGDKIEVSNGNVAAEIK